MKMYRNQLEMDNHRNKNLYYAETEADKRITEPLWETTLISTTSSGCLLLIGVAIRKL